MMRFQAIIGSMPAAQKNEALSQLNQIQANRAQAVQAKRVHHSDSATSISSQQASPKPTATTKAHPSKKKLKNAAAFMPWSSQAATKAPTDTSPDPRFIIIDGSNVARE